LLVPPADLAAGSGAQTAEIAHFVSQTELDYSVPTIGSPEINVTKLSVNPAPVREVTGLQSLEVGGERGELGDQRSEDAAKPKGLWAFITGADKAINMPTAR
jgi:hypothetical protein